MKKTVLWLSGGVSSFIAGWVLRDKLDEIIYIDVDDQHPDTMRFAKDCAEKIGLPLTVLKSKYGSVENVVKSFRYVNGAGGAKCTDVLKKRVRKEWEAQQKGVDLVYVWGFDSKEKGRAERLRDTMSHAEHEFPLIDCNISKEEAHGMCKTLGIKRPVMYDMGYRNNNCIGCVKGGMGYWNRIRQDFPEVFAERAALERLIGHSCIKGVFLDELDPTRGRIEDEIMEDCGIACELNLLDSI